MKGSEKLKKELRYGPGFDAKLLAERVKADELYFIFNTTSPTNISEKERILRELLPNKGKDIVILPPFYTDYGYNCIIGDNTFINHNAYLMDGAKIIIGKNCFIGPNCGMYTVNHPIIAEERNMGYEIVAPICIGDNVWIGADVTILPGVTIGENSVIGANSIVTKDIPANVVAAGNPCEVYRDITENDKINCRRKKGMERNHIHLINELPHIYELEDMIQFCKKYKRLYIYGRAINQEYLLKYFDMCDVKIDGFVVSTVREQDKNCFTYRELPVFSFKELYDRNELGGIILALSDRHYKDVIPLFRKYEFKDYFVMTEFNKRSIANQVRPRSHEELAFEISLTDHCNLSCQMCDHFSQLSDPWFVDMNQFDSDLAQMGRIFEHSIGYISLLGGEPTLHENLIDCIKIVRREFPDSELIILTNGIRLLELEHGKNGNLWEVCKDYDVHITVTVYPIKLDYSGIEQKAKEYNVSLTMSSNIHAEELTKIVKISDKHTMDLEASIDKFYCVNCLYFNKFNVLKDGRLYMCPIAAHINIFNHKFKTELQLKEEDSLDIYKIKDWREIAEFSSRYIPFCSYCDLKNWGPHSQWKASKKTIDEYVGV